MTNFSLVFGYADLCKVQKQSPFQSAVISEPGTISVIDFSGRKTG